jgi:hypothetical protein
VVSCCVYELYPCLMMAILVAKVLRRLRNDDEILKLIHRTMYGRDDDTRHIKRNIKVWNGLPESELAVKHVASGEKVPKANRLYENLCLWHRSVVLDVCRLFGLFDDRVSVLDII